MKLLAACLCVAAARKAPKKFESAIEMTLDAPAIESSKDQFFCVAPPDARRVAPAQRVQGARGAVRHLRGPGRALRADALLEDDRQEDVLPRGEDGVSPFVGVDNWYFASGKTLASNQAEQSAPQKLLSASTAGRPH